MLVCLCETTSRMYHLFNSVHQLRSNGFFNQIRVGSRFLVDDDSICDHDGGLNQPWWRRRGTVLFFELGVALFQLVQKSVDFLLQLVHFRHRRVREIAERGEFFFLRRHKLLNCCSLLSLSSSAWTIASCNAQLLPEALARKHNLHGTAARAKQLALRIRSATCAHRAPRAADAVHEFRERVL